MTEDENSLTAALVAALVQTRDGPPPPPPPPATTTTFTQQGTLTRSGRRTRPTPFALPTPTPTSPAPTPEQQQSQQPTSQRVRWSAQEDSELIKLIREEPPLTWLQMGQRLNRPGQGCAMRWYNFIRKTVEKNEADQLSNKIRGNNNGQTTTTTKKRSKSVSPEEEVQQYEEIPLPPPPPPQPIQPSIEMQVGSSRSAAYDNDNDEEEALVLPSELHTTSSKIDGKLTLVSLCSSSSFTSTTATTTTEFLPRRIPINWKSFTTQHDPFFTPSTSFTSFNFVTWTSIPTTFNSSFKFRSEFPPRSSTRFKPSNPIP